MKKILLILAALFVTLGASAQTTVQVNDTTMGYLVQYPAIDVITSDTTIVLDTTTAGVDTLEVVTYDTTYIPGYYDYQAIAKAGYKLSHWEVITTYNIWYDFDSTGAIPIDSVYSDTLIQYDVEYLDGYEDTIDHEGWLDWDMGVPDLDTITIEGTTSITITAYFIQNTTGIGSISKPAYTVYPNPTTGTVKVQGPVRMMTLLDNAGRIIEYTDNGTINLAGYPQGIYFLRIMGPEGGMSTAKVIKK